MPVKFLSSFATVVAVSMLLNVAHALPTVQNVDRVVHSTGASLPHNLVVRAKSAQTGTFERALKSIEANRMALKKHPREREPLEWARIQDDLGIAHGAVGFGLASI